MDYLFSIMANTGMIAFVALSAYTLLIVGQISFGQQGFFAIGAYVAGICTVVWQLPLFPANPPNSSSLYFCKYFVD